MHSSGINGEGELRGQLANPGSPGKMAVKTVCVRAWKPINFWADSQTHLFTSNKENRFSSS